MNKKGLVVLLLFVVSSLGVAAVSNAQTQNKVEVTLNYVPPSYVPQGYAWVEFDDRYISDGQVFGQNDKIFFGFYYDVAFVSWAGGADAYGDGFQPDYWYISGPDENGTYTETRFCGQIEVFLDDVDMGISNFDISASGGADTYQELRVSLTIGWHTLTVIVMELVSDDTHTTWHWDYDKDQVQFYVGKTDKDIPPLQEAAENTYVNGTATAVESDELTQHAYNWTNFGDIRPVADPKDYGQLAQQIDVGATAKVDVVYNTSWTDDIALTMGSYGVMFADIMQMGPGNITWWANTGDMSFSNTVQFDLNKGVNYVYFVVFGMKADDYSVAYGNPSPAMRASSQIFTIIVGEIETTGVGPSFAVFISVSILGLAAVVMLRRRK
ncbi:MAG: hypothetical protein ACTSYD_03730 [Candidatus Heimdallarchaeaceae archaeon]